MTNKKYLFIGIAALLFNFGFTGCDNGTTEGGKTPPVDIPKEPGEPEEPQPLIRLGPALEWIKNNAENNETYAIVLTENEISAAIALNEAAVNNKTGVTIILKGGEGDNENAKRTITLEGKGALFSIQNDSTDGIAPVTRLVLGKNITLQGAAENSSPLVIVKQGGELEMLAGSKISGNKIAAYYGTVYGGGVCVEAGGALTMTGGEISGSAARRGGGVYINGGAFTMTGGEISGNNAESGSGIGSGGGVYIAGSALTLAGGKISGNTAHGSGGGVYVANGSLTMEAGSEISGNNAAGGSGGGVFVYRSAAFTMDGGEIYSNNYNLHGGNGGGVYVDNNAAFTMTGGEIYGHTLISNNNWNSVQYGGGVYVHNMGTFNKTGGIIYGYSEDEPKSNKIRGLYTSGYIINGNGHAVYAGAAKRRETTAGPELNLDSTKTGQAGGWEQ